MRIGFVLGIGMSLGYAMIGGAWADQCIWMSEQQARAAAAYVHVGDRVSDFCEGCGETTPGAPRIVRRVEVRPVARAEGFSELDINGTAVDLAYLFVESKQRPGTFDNLGKLSGCPVQGVSASIQLR
jgi:hypothetical protein